MQPPEAEPLQAGHQSSGMPDDGLPPVAQYLYRHFDEEGVLLYVGVSLRAFQRLGQHKDNSHWFVRIGKVTLERHPSREAVLDAERRAILLEKPLHNIQRRPHAGGKPLRVEAAPTRPDASRSLLLGRMVQFKPMYKAGEVAELLGIRTPQINRWMDVGKLGYIPIEGPKPHPRHGDRPPKVHRYVTGWQLIDFLEWLEHEAEHQRSGPQAEANGL